MKFKNTLAELDYSVAPKKLKEVCEFFETCSLFYGVTPIVTRVREGVCGDSGVHEAGRAVDFRDQYVLPDGTIGRLYTGARAEDICHQVNQRFPRSDGKPTCLHHSFTGPSGVPQPYHFHVQVEAQTLLPGEPLARIQSDR